jgi:hypothetical protein
MRRDASSSKQTLCSTTDEKSVISLDNLMPPMPDDKHNLHPTLPMGDTLGEGEDANRSASTIIEKERASITIEGEEQEHEYQGKGWAFYLAFLSICLSGFLSALDLTTVSTALPTIVGNLPAKLEHGHRFHPNNTMVLALQDSNSTLCHALISRGSLQQGPSFIWIGTAYSLAGTAIMPWMGSVAQIWGRKNLFIGAIILFASGSAICGSAPSLSILILGRGKRREPR